ncbi:hypothetical protein [Streptomyces beigongshangae]|uniref:hypothetical protein n=1 Tax=Streptomyces beigongshangae TaxID=2841597 RepID=UPI001C856B57|nr:hypothetical protein [Streptomyces sp. REN17]
MAEYEEMAAKESRHVLEALIARHNARMLAMAEIPPEAVKPVSLFQPHAEA